MKKIGTDSAEWLNGTEFNDELYGLGGNDLLTGGGGDDYLVGGAGADALQGQAGIDTVDYNGDAGVYIDLAAGGGARRRATRSPASRMSMAPISATIWSGRGRTTASTAAAATTTCMA